MSTQWVQHKSGQGEKWELTPQVSANKDEYRVLAKSQQVAFKECVHYLPKSEYVLCPPVEQWVDVTEQCELSEGLDGQHREIRRDGQWAVGYVVAGYRLRKVAVYRVQGMSDEARNSACISWAFIIEKRTP